MSDLIIQELNRRLQKADIPYFTPGDTVSVQVRVVEGNKERIQVFKGTVIRIRGRVGNGTFTVRKISSGIGVERTFPFNSPTIAGISVDRQGSVRRAKLYYLRERVGKSARIRDRGAKAEQGKGARGKKAKG